MFVAIPPIPAQAAIQAYTNGADFSGLITGRPTTTVTFDLVGDGTQIPNNSVFGGILFDPNDDLDGELEVINGLGGPYAPIVPLSPDNYLGSTISGFIGQSFQFTIQAPVNAVGLYILSEGVLELGDIGLRLGTGLNDELVLLDPGPAPLYPNEIVLTNGPTTTYAYFLGFAETNPLLSLPTTTFTLENLSPFEPQIGIDNIIYATAVPEPGTVLFLSLAAAGVGYRVRRRNRLSAGAMK